jgi:hypothetical protein
MLLTSAPAELASEMAMEVALAGGGGFPALMLSGLPPPQADSSKTTAKPQRYFMGFICFMELSKECEKKA